MASGNGSNFEAIVQAINTGRLGAEIPLLVVNNKNCGAQQRADRFGIHLEVVDHRSYPNREALDRQLVSLFQSHQVDVVVMAGWMRIVTDVLVKAFPERLVNIHPSILPTPLQNACNSKNTFCFQQPCSKTLTAGVRGKRVAREVRSQAPNPPSD